jgi:hypothetical protein
VINDEIEFVFISGKINTQPRRPVASHHAAEGSPSLSKAPSQPEVQSGEWCSRVAVARHPDLDGSAAVPRTNCSHVHTKDFKRANLVATGVATALKDWAKMGDLQQSPETQKPPES